MSDCIFLLGPNGRGPILSHTETQIRNQNENTIALPANIIRIHC